MKNICVGIEGGGTKTRALVAIGAEPPVLIERKRSLKFAGGEFDGSAQTLLEILSEVPNFNVSDLGAIAIGLSGASRSSDQELYRQAIRSVARDSALPIHIESDASLTLSVALEPDEAGMLLIAGTGSALVDRDANGQTHLFGGLGPEIGDEGSGYWIGLEALRHFTMQSSAPRPDKLSDMVKHHLTDEVRKDPARIADLISRKLIRPSEFAPIVFMLSGDDTGASDIIREAAHHLGSLVRAGVSHLALEHGADLHLTGSIAKQPEMLLVLGEDVRDLGLVMREVEDDAPVKKALTIARELLNKT